MAATAEAFDPYQADVRLRHALVCDSDPRTASRVSATLRRYGHVTHTLAAGSAIAACLEDDAPDLLLVGVGDADDLGQVRDLRDAYDGPVVCYCTAASARDRIALLACGVDDVVPSPLSYQELALRVAAVARRSEAADGPADDTLTCGGLTTDEGTKQVKVRGDWVQLTAIEFALLVFLMRTPRVAYTRRQLLRRVWGYEIGDTSTVSVHVRRLRQKLERDTACPELIRTVWGSGYYFDPGDD